MRVLLAGASGALGHTLTPALVTAGHQVFGTTRSGNTAAISKAGATPIRMDGLDRSSVMATVEEAKPDVIIHQLTSLRAGMNPKQFDRSFGPTNLLRTEGTDHLLEAARTFGVGRLVAQSFTGWTNPRTGTGLADEDHGPRPAPGAAVAPDPRRDPSRGGSGGRGDRPRGCRAALRRLLRARDRHREG